MKWLDQYMLWHCIYTRPQSGPKGRMVVQTLPTVGEAADLISVVNETLNFLADQNAMMVRQLEFKITVLICGDPDFVYY